LKWLNDLKLAIIKEDIDSVVKLATDMPSSFETLRQMQEAQALIGKAIKIIEEKKSDTAKEMNKIKKIREFVLNS